MSAEVLPEHPIQSSSFEGDGNNDDDFSAPSGPLSTVKTYDENSSIAKLPGTALLRSVHNKPKNGSNHGSVKSLHSDHTYNFDKTNGSEALDNFDEFGEDIASSPVNTNKKVPAWKLRQQAQRSGIPPNESDKKISPLKAARARAANHKNPPKTRPGNENEQNWLKKLTTKKETPEEKEKRIKSEALIEKQVPSRWGKDILEEDDEEDESNSNEVDTNEQPTEADAEEEDESDTVKKVKSLIEKSFGSALVSTIKKDKEAAKDDEKKEEETSDNSGGRGNRWAMMGSAAMSGVRNVQRGLRRGDENDKTEKESVTEGEDEDQVADMEQNGNPRGAMWRNRGAAAFTSVRNAWGGADARRNELFNGDEPSAHDDLDSKSAHSDPGRNNRESSSDNEHNNNKFLSSIGNFLQHTRARFDPEVWADPEIQETLAAIEKLRDKLNNCRTDHRNTTRRRERQIENSISQQKNFLARKLARQMYGYRSNPFHPCIKEVYEKEILIIVHEVTNLGADDDSDGEQDGIDELLSLQKFNYDYDTGEEDTDENEAIDTLGAFFSKNKEKGSDKKRGDNASVDGSLFSVDGSTIEIGGNSIVPLQTRLIRAQHNEWMTDHQMELVRNFQQKSIEHLYDVIPEIQKEHEQLKAIPQSAIEAKIKEMEESNKKLKESYQAHVEAQEKLLAIYRERYVPSVHEDEDDDDDEDKKERIDEGDDTIGSPVSAAKGAPKRPGMWAKNLSRSVRGLFAQQNEENGGEMNSVGNQSRDSKGGFDLPSPATTGSQSKNKFLLSFGSPAGSKAASGILANFAAPLPLSKDDEASDKQSQQDSAKDSAAAAWTVPKMDKDSLPETLAEKRAKRAAARRANRPDAPTSDFPGSKPSKTASSTSRSELLQRARKAREESAAALVGAPSKQPSSPTPSSRSGRNSLRSNTASTRKELSMKDLMAAAGDSRRKLMENDSRMERLAQKKDHLSKTSPLSPTPSVASTRAGSRISERLRMASELNDGSSHHSLHERKPRARSLKSAPQFGDEEDGEEPINESSLHDVDEFGEEAL